MDGSWKLYHDKEEMYNIQKDGRETENVWENRKFRTIRDRLITNLQLWNATLPTINIRKAHGYTEPIDICPAIVIGPPDV